MAERQYAQQSPALQWLHLTRVPEPFCSGIDINLDARGSADLLPQSLNPGRDRGYSTENLQTKMTALAEFPYSGDALSNLRRAFVTALLFLSVWFFLAGGDSTSLFDGRIGAPLQLSAEQNLGANLLCALGFSILGFLNLFWIWQNRRSDLKSVLVLEDRIIAPRQGVSGKPVEISISDIKSIKQLSVKQRWEFHVYGSVKHIRVPKASLEDPEDFERLVSCVQKVADGHELEIEQRT